MFDHEKCQTCGGEIAGLADTVLVTQSTFDSFHVQHHLSCYMATTIATERARIAVLEKGLRDARSMLAACQLDEPDDEFQDSWDRAVARIDAALAQENKP